MIKWQDFILDGDIGVLLNIDNKKGSKEEKATVNIRKCKGVKKQETKHVVGSARKAGYNVLKQIPSSKDAKCSKKISSMEKEGGQG